MRILSRIFFVLLILGGLGYGSYAFGRYFLSASLFGSQVLPSGQSGLAVVSSQSESSVTRKTDLKGGSPRVEMRVLPADEAGPGPEPPSLENLQRATGERVFTRREATTNPALAPTDVDENGRRTRRRFDEPPGTDLTESLNPDEEERPRRRRRRRSTSNEAKPTATAATESTARSDAGTLLNSSSGSSSSSNDSASSRSEGSRDDGTGSDSRSRESRSNSTTRSSSDSGSSSSSGRNSESTRGETRSITSASSGSSEPRRSRRRPERSQTNTRSSGESSTRRSTPTRRERSIESPIPRAEDSSSPVPIPE